MSQKSITFGIPEELSPEFEFMFLIERVISIHGDKIADPQHRTAAYRWVIAKLESDVFDIEGISAELRQRMDSNRF